MRRKPENSCSINKEGRKEGRKEITMSNQPENEMQQTPTPEEVRQYALAEIEVTKQVITELSDEELEEIAGAALGAQLSGMVATYKFARTRRYNDNNRNDNGVGASLKYAWNNGRSTGNALSALGKQ